MGNIAACSASATKPRVVARANIYGRGKITVAHTKRIGSRKHEIGAIAGTPL
jgi:hypothetical protein